MYFFSYQIYIKGRKNDAASVLEATVDYVKYVREKIPPAIMGQITEVLQSNRKFCKKQQMPIQLSVPGTIMGQRYDNLNLVNPKSPCYFSLILMLEIRQALNPPILRTQASN